jgi:hypothetical protein
MTSFEKIDGTMNVEVEMPYPVRVGDEIEIYATGYNLTVQSVAWVIGLADQYKEQTVELIARCK